MKITPNILSIAPYISTAWKTISSMYVKEESGLFRLIILLNNGGQVEIPSLDKESISTIFDAHAKYSGPAIESLSLLQTDLPLSLAFPFKNEGGIIDAFGPTAEHNPDQADLPPLPPGILKKISVIAQAFGVDTLATLPIPEPGCNCIYCQVMHALQEESEPEEEVSKADLQFRDWEIKQTAEKLYNVTNPIDDNEHYSVFLGEPIGCTCGHKNCDHIRAVLNT